MPDPSMPKSLAISIQPASDLKSRRFRITAISAAIPSLVFNRFRGDFGCGFTGTLRFQIASDFLVISNRCDRDFAIWASKTQPVIVLCQSSSPGRGASPRPTRREWGSRGAGAQGRADHFCTKMRERVRKFPR